MAIEAPLGEVGKQEAPLFTLVADIALDGQFVDHELQVFPDEIRIVSDGTVVESLSLSGVQELRAEGLVGNGSLIAVENGAERLIARYSSRYLAQYTDMARQVNRLLKNERFTATTTFDDDLCPTCGLPFPAGSSVCPRCINKSAVLKRLWQVTKPHTKLLAMATAIFWGIMMLRLANPQIQRLLVDSVLQSSTGTFETLMFYVGLMVLVTLATNGLHAAQARVMTTLSSRLSRDLRAMVYAKIQALSLNYISRKKTGDLMNRVRRDTNTIQRFIQGQAATGINEGLMLIGVSILIFNFNWKLALMVILPAPFVVGLAAAIRHRIRRMYHRQWRAGDKADSLMQDVLTGVRVVKAFGQEEREITRFVDYSQQMADITAYNEKTWNTLFPSLRYIMGIGSFIVLYFGGSLVLGGEMQVGELWQFSLYAGMLYGPLQFVSFFPRWFTEAMTASERIFDVIDAEPDIQDREDSIDHTIHGRIEFQGVTFGYEKHDPVLESIDLVVEPGEMIGLVGHSGAGKSTLINLVSRFYDADEGSILIDGIDIRRISQRNLRTQIGVVLQETFLFSGSIYENIAYAKSDATPEEVIRAAKIANAHDFIMRFTDGYDTRVGERGQRLSGGERQRIAIARAILHDPKVLILDEATASVDTDTEYQIQEALARLVENRTTIAIAHRLSTLRNADRLVVLDKGRVAEMGSHDELMAAKGIYHRLVMAQREMSRVRGVDG